MLPVYFESYKQGKFESKLDSLKSLFLGECQLCARQCMIDRSKALGFCSASDSIQVSSFGPHHGEERPISGVSGSGTIFFTHCNLKCVFCQNYDISILGNGYEVSSEQLAEIMLQLQEQGCHNINFVTPTHYSPLILEAVISAVKEGLNIPLVYNCGGYESIKVIKILDGVIDIYMPDLKFFDSELSRDYCNAPDYFKIASKVIKEMFSQVGPLILNSQGIASKGLMIRHLVMPGTYDDSRKLLKFISNELSKDVYVNIMAQYHPAWKSREFNEINHRIDLDEYYKLIKFAKQIGLDNLDR